MLARNLLGDIVTVLYHYTCRHSAEGIHTTGVILPGVVVHGQVVGGACLAWFTDLAPPVPRAAVGLTSVTLRCDRTERVFTVARDASGIRRWVDVRRSYRQLWPLEHEDGSMPMHWFVSEDAVPIIRDRVAEETSQ